MQARAIKVGFTEAVDPYEIMILAMESKTNKPDESFHTLSSFDSGVMWLARLPTALFSSNSSTQSRLPDCLA
jgi:hypothetical protein